MKTKKHVIKGGNNHKIKIIYVVPDDYITKPIIFRLSDYAKEYQQTLKLKENYSEIKYSNILRGTGSHKHTNN